MVILVVLTEADLIQTGCEGEVGNVVTRLIVVKDLPDYIAIGKSVHSLPYAFTDLLAGGGQAGSADDHAEYPVL